MIAAAMLLAVAQVDGAAGGADPPNGLTFFKDSVKAYVKFITPHCAGEEIYPYTSFTDSRDRDFRRSLRGTPLEEPYRAAVREQQAQDLATVYECAGPPPPPPSPGAPPVDLRARAISEAQKRLRSIASNIPGVFDRGDTLFAAMMAARDQVSGERR